MIGFTLEGDVEQLKNESGGHRWQRVPPTEHKGRVHTSTVTVVVTEVGSQKDYTISDNEIEITTKRGSGKGGQHRNKTDSCVVARHIPTQIEVKIDGRNQHQNKKVALDILQARVRKHFEFIDNAIVTQAKKELAGTGMRGDKIRTYREQDDLVKDHRSNKKARLSDLYKGNLQDLFE